MNIHLKYKAKRFKSAGYRILPPAEPREDTMRAELFPESLTED